MNHKIRSALLVILVASVTFLFYQDFKLNKKISELTKGSDEVKITPTKPEAKSVNEEVSPFDKPNTDPLSDQFPSESLKMPELTSMKFDRTTHDFGRINEGEMVRAIFKFTNTGKNPLIINRAQGSCGCTVPRWPEHPIKVGGRD